MNRISELRAEKGISMKEAARLLNMPYTTYVNYEKGTREPNSETLIALANFYNTSVDYLIGKSSLKISEKEYTELENYRNARNRLAHMKILELSTIEQILKK